MYIQRRIHSAIQNHLEKEGIHDHYRRQANRKDIAVAGLF